MTEQDFSHEYDTLAMGQVLKSAEYMASQVYANLKAWHDGSRPEFSAYFSVDVDPCGMDVNTQAHALFQLIIKAEGVTDGAIDVGGKKLFVTTWDHEDGTPHTYLYADSEETIQEHRRVAAI